ncbi:MAG: alpha/beta hydrolase, partial [Planctomycetaceae bacterium]|nr:alpha/beta hydrolase [Planctomycetaceae bacterium]
GRSLGGAVAVDLAAETGAKGLIVESSFASIPAMAKKMVPFMPHDRFIENKLDSLSRMKTYHDPLLMCHGDIDTVIPFEQGKAVFDACPGHHKTFLRLCGHNHNDPLPDDYFTALDNFYRNLKTQK